MAKRTIDSDGLDVMQEGKAAEPKQDAPCWHAWVGDGFEPVPIGEITNSGEDILLAGGWLRSMLYGFVQQVDSSPRRRRKRQRFAVCTTDLVHGSIDNEYCKVIASTMANVGDLLEVQPDGTLKLVDNRGND